MFCTQLRQQPPIPLKQDKRAQFRTQIRSRQIQQIKRQIRQRYYQFKQQSDYQLLKQINLPMLIQRCKKQGLYHPSSSSLTPTPSQHIHSLFLYASSKNSDHLFSLLDDDFIEMLVHGLIVNREVNAKGESVPIWNREILWILTNYTAYSQVLNQGFICKIQEIFGCLFGNCGSLFAEETQQNIVLSVSNLLSNSKTCRQLLKNYHIVQKLLRSFLTRTPALISLIQNSFDHQFSKLLYYYCELLHNLFTAVEFTQLPELYQDQVVKYLFQLLIQTIPMGDADNRDNSDKGDNRDNRDNQDSRDRNGKGLIMVQDNKKLVYIMLHALVKIFGNSVDNQPQIILKFKKWIRKLGLWFQKFVKTQIQSAKSNTIIISYIQLQTVIYGPNIPQQQQQRYYKLYVKQFQTHIGKICTSFFRHPNPVLHLHILKLLQPILLQLCLCELIIQQYLPIISHIFDHIKNSSYKLKSEALLCLINVIKCVSYNESFCVADMLQILISNQIADVLAQALWEFVDGELNLQILQAVQILIEGDKNLYGARLRFWGKFQEAGGILKMQKILQQSVNVVLKQEVNKILDSVAHLNETKEKPE